MGHDQDFSALERLTELGFGLAIAQQMVSTMNHVMAQSTLSGTVRASNAQDQQAFYVVENGAVGGPWSRAQLQAAVLSGRLQRDSYAWTPGMSQWGRLGDMTHFAGAAPPPPPPPKIGESA